MMSTFPTPILLGSLLGPITDPVAIFLTIMAIMLVAPLVFERLNMPGIIGLILAGVVVGESGLGILQRDDTIVLLGTVGLLFLMFLAGLETSLNDLKNNAGKALSFGFATFLFPMAIGTGAMLLLDYSLLASILVASCFASHTLVALPILNRLGIMKSPAAMVIFGGTLITNILALLVLAVVVRAHQGELTLGFWLFLIPSLTIFTFATLLGLPIVGRWFFARFGHDEGAEFTFVVATLLVVSYAARLIDVEPIIGAFLAGIAIAQIVPRLSPLMNRIQFIGNTLFVPFFLISVGMLVDPLILIREPRSIVVALVMLGAEGISKFLGAWLPGKAFGMGFPSIMTMFGLSSAQAASTLAAITVAFDIELVDELTVNGIIAMILVTCVASPWITTRWGQQLKASDEATATVAETPALAEGQDLDKGQRVLVPVANPNTEDNLLQLALILAKKSEGTLLPLHIIIDEDGRPSEEAQLQQTTLLAAAESVANAAVTKVEPIGRLADSIDKGIVRTAIESKATLIICGWKGYSSYQDNFFGGVIDNVVRRSPIPVLITRFPKPLGATRRLLLAVSDLETQSHAFRQTAVLACSLGEELKASILLLQVITRPGSPALDPQSVNLPAGTPCQQVRGSFVGSVRDMLQDGDLLILSSHTHPYVFGQPALGTEPEAIARNQQGVPMIIMHFPD